MINLDPAEIWYITGSQHLYGETVLKQVATNSRKIVDALNVSKTLPLKIIFKPILTTPDQVRQLCLEANNAPKCAGLILWMHTFSPSKMWIGGLTILRKPLLHLHTQFNRDMPWAEIDMDFMNLNQSAHGDREARFHAHAYAAESQSRRRPLAGLRSSGPNRHLDAARRARGTIGRAQNSAGSATTCARSPSLKAIKSPPRQSWVIRSTAMASAIW